MSRITSDIDQNLKDAITSMAEKDKRSFSYTVSVLLQQAVKEKLRKQRTGTKKDNTP
jgi:hypothetical protein